MGGGGVVVVVVVVVEDLSLGKACTSVLFWSTPGGKGKAFWQQIGP